MQIGDAIRKLAFPCEKRLNEKLNEHKKEVESLILAIREDKKAIKKNNRNNCVILPITNRDYNA